MFFTTPEEWIGLAIALPICIAAGVISAKLALRRRARKANRAISFDPELYEAINASKNRFLTAEEAAKNLAEAGKRINELMPTTKDYEAAAKAIERLARKNAQHFSFKCNGGILKT